MRLYLGTPSTGPGAGDDVEESRKWVVKEEANISAMNIDKWYHSSWRLYTWEVDKWHTVISKCPNMAANGSKWAGDNSGQNWTLEASSCCLPSGIGERWKHGEGSR